MSLESDAKKPRMYSRADRLNTMAAEIRSLRKRLARSESRLSAAERLAEAVHAAADVVDEDGLCRECWVRDRHEEWCVAEHFREALAAFRAAGGEEG